MDPDQLPPHREPLPPAPASVPTTATPVETEAPPNPATLAQPGADPQAAAALFPQYAADAAAANPTPPMLLADNDPVPHATIPGPLDLKVPLPMPSLGTDSSYDNPQTRARAGQQHADDPLGTGAKSPIDFGKLLNPPRDMSVPWLPNVQTPATPNKEQPAPLPMYGPSPLPPLPSTSDQPDAGGLQLTLPPTPTFAPQPSQVAPLPQLHLDPITPPGTPAPSSAPPPASSAPPPTPTPTITRTPDNPPQS